MVTRNCFQRLCYSSPDSASGQITPFYLFAMVPVAFGLLILAVDVSRWNSLRDFAQREADRMAFQAAQLLPADTSEAEAFLRQFQPADSPFSVQVDPLELSGNDRVAVTLGADYVPVFSSLLSALMGSRTEARQFHVERRGIVQIVPTDIMLVVADGQSLRPAVGAPSWGDSPSWPAAEWWSCSPQPPPATGDERWATQSCFNPVLSRLKLATIGMVDTFAAVKSNRLGLVFTPGNTTGLNYQFSRFISGSPGGFSDRHVATPESEWLNYAEEGNLGNELCVVMSAGPWSSRYALASVSSPYGFQYAESSSQEVLDFPQCDLTSTPYGRLNPDYRANTLRLREMIYWNAAKRGFDADVTTAVEQAIVALLPQGDEAAARQVRGELAIKPRRLLIVVADSLPEPQGARWQRISESLQQAQIELVLVPFEHTVYGGMSSGDLAALRQRVTQFQELAASLGGDESRKYLRAFEPVAIDDLQEVVSTKLVALGRQLVIQS